MIVVIKSPNHVFEFQDSGDAYVDHPSFGMAVIGRTLEAQGFRVGIISQPDYVVSQSHLG